MTENEPLRQLRAAGYEDCLRDLRLTEHAIVATADLGLVERLCGDPHFKRGIFYGLHQEVGNHLTEFRSFRGQFGKGSLQIVVDQTTGALHCDVDAYSPYDDLVGVFGHVFVEVIPNWFKRRRKRKQKET